MGHAISRVIHAEGKVESCVTNGFIQEGGGNLAFGAVMDPIPALRWPAAVPSQINYEEIGD